MIQLILCNFIILALLIFIVVFLIITANTVTTNNVYVLYIYLATATEIMLGVVSVLIFNLLHIKNGKTYSNLIAPFIIISSFLLWILASSEDLFL